jgi:succinate dehydrogenase hydrophobic anchor subunit
VNDLRVSGISIIVLTFAILVLFFSTQGLFSPIQTPIGTITPQIIALIALIILLLILIRKWRRY